ncbi:sulfatase [Muricauda sp. CAU 1633]|uniref:sulfatase family protein n=1 Tax=Allomuricauda sp. CAU 1633 TaxID=2816036 RepID=UPI001A8EDEA0|nr:sulfatase [Muricauda sp. CAU 1633]MBO0322931.1 sulfatase [Muricauda sp. CAU 1633]
MKKIILCLALITFILGCKNSEKQVVEDKPPQIINPKLDFKPNIVWIVAEDLSPYIPAFGDSTIVTPALNQLAAEGVCYDNFFSPHPVCAPARAAIITGMYANSIGASHMRTGPWFSDTVSDEVINNYASKPIENINYEAVPPAEVKMFTEYLRGAGYYCTNNKKEDYQFRKTMTAWDESSDQAHWRNRPDETPFFSVFNIEVTHESRIWSKATDSLWVDKNLEVSVPPYLPDTKVGKKDFRRMYSNILEMDHKVGQILEDLQTDGLLDSTIVVWYTDHGGPLPRQKRLLYDSGLKVPMIIRFPNGEFYGLRDNRIISFIDLAPTVLSLAGIEPPNYMEGKAFLGDYMRTEEPEYAFGAADRFDEFTDHMRSVRDKKFKYIKNYELDKPVYSDVAYRKQMPIMQELLQLKNQNQLTPTQALWFNSPKAEEELYDLENDPHELNNLAGNPEYKDRLEKMRLACNDWVKEIGDTGLQPENELIESFWPNQEQPLTSIPKLEFKDGVLHISCSTDGASIGYRFNSDESWKIYNSPIQVLQSQKVEIVADRIGYKRSDTITFKP